jgi:hypothetical protein
MKRRQPMPKIINEVIPDLSVLAAYAKSIGYPFETYRERMIVIAHYKNFGSIKN